MSQKIFISHSSVQKPYVEEFLDAVGYDYTIVDKYSFESSEEIWSEIRRCIDECNFFLYLISKEALSSDWVSAELGYVRDRVDEGKIVFCPIIIDEDVSIENPKIKPWIKKAYLTNSFVHPRQLARLMRKKIMRSIWEQFPTLKTKEKLFIGRERELHNLEESFYMDFDQKKSSVIVSGLSHIGRKRLLREFVSNKLSLCDNPSDLIEIRLTDKDSIHEFVIQINDIVEVYTYDELLDRMRDKRDAVNISVTLLNCLQELKEHIVINDDRCIVRNDGRLTEWFVDIIKHKSLKPHLHFSIASRFTPRPNINELFPSVISLQIHPLGISDMSTLFKAYASLKNLEINTIDIDFFTRKFTGYPEQVIFAVDTIKNGNLVIAKKKVEDIISKFDYNYYAIINELKKDNRAFQILILLSYFEFISYDYLCNICGEDIADVLERFHYYSLTESFGAGNQYICLTPAIVDYVKRNRFKLDTSYKIKLREKTTEVITNTDDKISDISYRLYAAKEILRNRDAKVDERYLIPSFVLKVVIEEYYTRHDDNVISLADRILKGYHRDVYEDVIRSISYWLCCALCRKRNPRFFEEVKYFENTPYSYNFLYGFYYRQTQKYEKAKSYYSEALKFVQDDATYASKAEHEMVIVCMKLGNYDEAFELAERSYEKDPTNTYHIESYFRCLVRSERPNRDALFRLINEMQSSFDSHREVISSTMLAEYEFFVNGDFEKAIGVLKAALEQCHDTYRNYPLRSLREMCDGRKAMSIYDSIVRTQNLSSIIDKDFDLGES